MVVDEPIAARDKIFWAFGSGTRPVPTQRSDMDLKGLSNCLLTNQNAPFYRKLRFDNQP